MELCLWAPRAEKKREAIENLKPWPAAGCLCAISIFKKKKSFAAAFQQSVQK